MRIQALCAPLWIFVKSKRLSMDLGVFRSGLGAQEPYQKKKNSLENEGF